MSSRGGNVLEQTSSRLYPLAHATSAFLQEAFRVRYIVKYNVNTCTEIFNGRKCNEHHRFLSKMVHTKDAVQDKFRSTKQKIEMRSSQIESTLTFVLSI
eukprot:scaffold69310_cov48-Attheya_sp.AAC.8